MTRRRVFAGVAGGAAVPNLGLALVLGTIAVLPGCGGGQVKTYPTTGEVVFADGSPLKGGTVLFNSDEHKDLTGRALIQPDGSFELGTYDVGDGAVAGRHTVAILPPSQSTDVDRVGYQSPIDVMFMNPRRSGLAFEVKADGTENHFRIEVKPPKRRR